MNNNALKNLAINSIPVSDILEKVGFSVSGRGKWGIASKDGKKDPSFTFHDGKNLIKEWSGTDRDGNSWDGAKKGFVFVRDIICGGSNYEAYQWFDIHFGIKNDFQQPKEEHKHFEQKPKKILMEPEQEKEEESSKLEVLDIYEEKHPQAIVQRKGLYARTFVNFSECQKIGLRMAYFAPKGENYRKIAYPGFCDFNNFIITGYQLRDITVFPQDDNKNKRKTDKIKTISVKKEGATEKPEFFSPDIDKLKSSKSILILAGDIDVLSAYTLYKDENIGILALFGEGQKPNEAEKNLLNFLQEKEEIKVIIDNDAGGFSSAQRYFQLIELGKNIKIFKPGTFKDFNHLCRKYGHSRAKVEQKLEEVSLGKFFPDLSVQKKFAIPKKFLRERENADLRRQSEEERDLLKKCAESASKRAEKEKIPERQAFNEELLEKFSYYIDDINDGEIALRTAKEVVHFINEQIRDPYTILYFKSVLAYMSTRDRYDWNHAKVNDILRFVYSSKISENIRKNFVRKMIYLSSKTKKMKAGESIEFNQDKKRYEPTTTDVFFKLIFIKSTTDWKNGGCYTISFDLFQGLSDLQKRFLFKVLTNQGILKDSFTLENFGCLKLSKSISIDDTFLRSFIIQQINLNLNNIEENGIDIEKLFIEAGVQAKERKEKNRILKQKLEKMIEDGLIKAFQAEEREVNGVFGNSKKIRFFA